MRPGFRGGLLLVAIAAPVAAGLAACWTFGTLSTRATPSRVPAPTPPGLAVHIPAGDDVVLAATYTPGARSDAPAVLMLHGNGESRDQMAATGAMLARHGYASLAIDFRGHGESTVRPHTFGWTESRDAHAGLAWLRQRQRGARIAVIGISLGGAAALIGPSGPLPADAMVLDAVYPDIRRAIGNRIAAMGGWVLARVVEPLLSYQSRLRFGVWPSALSPIDAVARYRGPVLVIGGGRDIYTPPAETRAIFAAARGPKRLWIVPGLDHGEVSSMTSAEYESSLLGFLSRTVGTP